MPLAGAAFLALWNDVVAEREADYERWHTFQHVPERVSVTGFHGARRYVDRSRERHRYFTLYELQALDVLESREYRELIDDPTPWSASMRPDLRDFLRAPCELESTAGTGIGSAVAIAAVRSSIAKSTVDDAVLRAHASARVNAVHVGRRATGGPDVAFGARIGDAPRAFDRIVLVEALDREAAAGALAHIAPAIGLEDVPRDFGAGVYDLALVFPGHDVDERLRHRRPSWDATA